MNIEFYPGFITYEFGPRKLLFVALHSTTSFDNVPRGDVGSDLLAVRLSKLLNSKAVISTTPREKELGIDFNRLPPTKEMALDMFSVLDSDNHGNEAAEYAKKYAWVASTENDYDDKKRVYDLLWSHVEALSDPNVPIIFIHTQDASLRNFPSLVDIIPLNFDGNSIQNAISKINGSYRETFEKIKPEILEFSIFHEKFYHKNIALQKFGSLDPKTFLGAAKENYVKMLDRVSYLGFQDLSKALEESYSFDKNLEAISEVGKNVSLSMTKMLNFTGKYAFGTRKFLDDKKRSGIEIEVNSFLSEVKTDLGVKILMDFLSEAGLSI